MEEKVLEIDAETARMSDCEMTSQVARKFNEIEMDLKSQILEAMNTAEHVLPSIQNTIGTQRPRLNAEVDLRSSVLHRSPKVEYSWTIRENCPQKY